MFEDPDSNLIYRGPDADERSGLWGIFLMLILALVFLAAFVVVARSDQIKPFTTDGCSGGMSASYRLLFRKPPPWEGCCVAHDRVYWQGGTADSRKQADKALYLCVKARGYPTVAAAMWAAVRPGGTPFMPFDWRWGYGYSYGHDIGTSYWYDRPNLGPDR